MVNEKRETPNIAVAKFADTTLYCCAAEGVVLATEEGGGGGVTSKGT